MFKVTIKEMRLRNDISFETLLWSPRDQDLAFWSQKNHFSSKAELTNHRFCASCSSQQVSTDRLVLIDGTLSEVHDWRNVCDLFTLAKNTIWKLQSDMEKYFHSFLLWPYRRCWADYVYYVCSELGWQLHWPLCLLCSPSSPCSLHSN